LIFANFYGEFYKDQLPKNYPVLLSVCVYGCALIFLFYETTAIAFRLSDVLLILLVPLLGTIISQLKSQYQVLSVCLLGLFFGEDFSSCLLIKMKKIPSNFEVSISVVSHGQIKLIEHLIHDLEMYCKALSLEVLITLNIEEQLTFKPEEFSFPIKIIRNPSPLGFGANHNQAYKFANGQYFCVINPDIRLIENPFDHLIQELKDVSIGVIGPLVIAENGLEEITARFFPTPFGILKKAFLGAKSPDYIIGDQLISPDWIGGMLMMLTSKVYEEVGGFDQRFFLYYEDVDLCARLKLLNYRVLLSPSVKVIHAAQRTSHRNLKFFKYHLTSMLSFFFSRVFLKMMWFKFSDRLKAR
jgi:glycosyltransferase involved in cell wall biosynthesis